MTTALTAVALALGIARLIMFIALHLGLGVPQRSFVAGAGGFLASSKLDITYRGVAAHAGGAPQDGKNALLAAASAALNLHAIPRHSAGASRINVGELHAGSGRNIIADHATLKIETRGANASVNDYLEAEARERQAQAEARATEMVSKAISEGGTNAINYFVAQEYVRALGKFAESEQQKTVFMPMEASGIIGALGGIAEMFNKGDKKA